MNPDRLLMLFERVAEAPDAVDCLRRFILDLAVRGKLVAQDPADEPASELMKRVAGEKTQLMEKGLIQKRRAWSSFDDEEPFKLPSGWRWVRLGDMVTKLTDGTHHSPPNGPSGDFKYITAKNIKVEGVSLSDVTFVSREIHEEIYSRCNPERGDILYIKDGATTGVVTINDLDEPFSMLSSVALLKLPSCVFNRLVVAFLRSPFFYTQIRGFMKGAAITRVTLKRMVPALIPLPPLSEQYRIVDKVDELMALCDRLEATRAEREAKRERLTAASISRLNTPDPDQTKFASDARFSLNILPTLTRRPKQLKNLRQTILNLAVRGKLVTQDPTDEPPMLKASVLEETPLIVPSSWRYTRLRNVLSEDTRNGYSRKPDDAPDGTPILRISSATIRGDGVVAEQEHKLISGIDPEIRVQYGLTARDLVACRFNGNKSFVGRLAIFRDELGIRPIYPDKLIRVRVAPQVVIPEFLQMASDTDIVRTEIEAQCATTVGNWGISASNLKEVRFPVPPVAEQRRIVAKVQELMTLCDCLQAGLIATDATQSRLLDALLADALTPPASEHPAIH